MGRGLGSRGSTVRGGGSRVEGQGWGVVAGAATRMLTQEDAWHALFVSSCCMLWLGMKLKVPPSRLAPLSQVPETLAASCFLRNLRPTLVKPYPSFDTLTPIIDC